MKIKAKTSLYQIVSWTLREIITPEEGLFLLRREIKSYFAALQDKEYSWR
ncbi:MAG: hypothetical protein GX050_06245 [Firmicutes bacterium]|nr:hypothetical protein [Bacillota bacterium]